MAHSELGDQLRRARESKGVSIEDVEKATAIRKRFLQAMEEGRFDTLPGEIQARGFLKNYANYLGLKPEEALASYERQVRSAQTAAALKAASPAQPVAVRPAPPQSKSQPAAPQPIRPVTPPPAAATLTQPAPTLWPATPAPPSVTQPAPAARPVTPASPAAVPSQPQSTLASASQPAAVPVPPTAATVPAAPLSQRPAWLTLETVLIALAAILVICVAVLAAFVFLGPMLNPPAPGPLPTVTRARATVPSPPTLPPATPTAAPRLGLTSTLQTAGTPGYVQVALAATEHVWVRVTTDGQTAFEGMFSPGQALNWEAKELLIVEAGNGAGLTTSVNGRPVGVMGPRGQLVMRAWTPTGETTVPATPTASIPPPSPTP